MLKKPFTRSTALATAFTIGLSAPATSIACSCLSITSEASTLAGTVASGSSSIVAAMESGFQMTAQVQAKSEAKATRSLVSGLEAMTAQLTSEIRQIPITEQELERRRALADPAQQATEPCKYSERGGDMGSSQKNTVSQLRNLNEASIEYNELPSTNNNPNVQSPSTQFYARANNALRNRDGLMKMGSRLVSEGDQYGAMSEDEVQNASLFTNLVTNPNPPARVKDPETFRQIAANVDADIHNLRMSLPQAVINQHVAYESPSLELTSESWVQRQLDMSGLDVDAEDMSYADLIQMMATHRIESPQWIANLSAKDKNGALKDLAMVKADAAFLDYELWKQEKNTALLMSQLLATTVQGEED